MANSWGEFIRDVPIINKKAEGIFVKVDHVIDLWEERNKLRTELEELRGGTAEGQPPALAAAEEAPPALAVEDASNPQAASQERARCADEIEAFAQSFPFEPEQREFGLNLLQAAAQHLRESKEDDLADFLSGVQIPPQAQAAAQEHVPTAEPVAEEVPMAEVISEERPPWEGLG